MKVLVCGDRNWRDEDTIALRLARLPGGTLIIHGDQGNKERTVGADRVADRIAEDMGLPREPHPALWDAHGLAAGPIRNSQMLERGPELVLAFHGFLERSRGTKDTVEKARALRIPVEVIAPRRKLNERREP
jgi:hypothetical protein